MSVGLLETAKARFFQDDSLPSHVFATMADVRYGIGWAAIASHQHPDYQRYD